MTDEFNQMTLEFLARRGLPARLDVDQTAKLLGFAVHDLAILTKSGKLNPLGDPAPNAPKFYAAIDVIKLLLDKGWLHRSTMEIGRYWRHKRSRRSAPQPSRASRPAITADLLTASTTNNR
jgi:hypothetical protein